MIVYKLLFLGLQILSGGGTIRLCTISTIWWIYFTRSKTTRSSNGHQFSLTDPTAPVLSLMR